MPPKKSKYSKSGGSKPAPTPEYTLDMIVDPTEDAPLDMEMIKKVTQTPDPTASNNIRVAVRIRPPNQRELDGGASNVIVHKEGLKVVVGEPPNAADFTYDVVLANATQPEAFEAIGVNIVHSAYHGFNSTCFAYGQTSSGKSYSMIGKLGGSTGIGEHTGITPRVATLLFDVAKAADATHEFFIEASFLEIYNEKVRDLLEPSTDPDTLKIRESPQHGVHVVGLTKRHVKSATEVVRTLITGFMNRTVSATAYNAESSRSHAVFELTVQQKYVEPASGEKMAKASKINLVDLAGSERSDKVGTKGAALVEGNNINLSLSVLGRCIKALVEVANEAAKNPPPPPPPKDGKKKKKKKGDEAEKPQGKVVPFRESVLTWYLRESLAGNARTTMLAACSPVALNKEETLSTLRYAASAKNIKTLASKNEDPMEAKVRELAEEIQRLKAALEAQEGGDGGGGGGGEDAQSSKWALAASRRGSIVVGLGAEETMSEEEKETYLEELESTMSRLLPGGFIRNSRQSMSGDNVLGQGSGPAQCYPLLSCLNKDEMLSHAMTVPVFAPEDGSGKFMVGRSGGAKENDFVLNGVGMQVRHAAITLGAPTRPQEERVASEESGELVAAASSNTVQSFASGAVVMVNGTTLPEAGSPHPLRHLDRLTLGPCRLIAIWCERPLTPDELATWTYEKALDEMMHHETQQWTLLTPTRRRLLDKLKEAEILFVEQANAIAIDMCTRVRFHATVILGDGVQRLHKATATVDEVLSDGDHGRDGLGGEVVIVCTVRPRGPKERGLSRGLSLREQKRRKRDQRKESKRDKEEADALRQLGDTPNPPSFLSDTMRLEDEIDKSAEEDADKAFFAKAAPSAAVPSTQDQEGLRGRLASFGVHRGQSINLFTDALEDATEDDDDDLMAGLATTLRDKAKLGEAKSEGRSSGASNGAGSSSESEKEEEEGEDDGGGGAGDANNTTLFKMTKGMFEELCAELKATYGSISSLCQGVSDLRTRQQQQRRERRGSNSPPSPSGSSIGSAFDFGGPSGGGGGGYGGGDSGNEGAGNNIVQEIFDTICDNPQGTITRSDLSAAFNLFDETAIDPTFAERSMGELLPPEMVQLDFSAFAGFVTKFVQRQFFGKLEPYVSNHGLFVSVGGRDLAGVMAKEQEAVSSLKSENVQLASRLEAASSALGTAKYDVERLMARLRQLSQEKNKLEERAVAAEAEVSSAKGAGGKKSPMSMFGALSSSKATKDAAARPPPSKKKSLREDQLEEDADEEEVAGAAQAGALKELSSDSSGTASKKKSKKTKKKESKNEKESSSFFFAAPREEGGGSGSGGAGGEGVAVLPEEKAAAKAMISIGEPRAMASWLDDLGLGQFKGAFTKLGAESVEDLLDASMVGDLELAEVGLNLEQAQFFKRRRARLRKCLDYDSEEEEEEEDEDEGGGGSKARAEKEEAPLTPRAFGIAKLKQADAPGGTGGHFSPTSEFGSVAGSVHGSSSSLDYQGSFSQHFQGSFSKDGKGNSNTDSTADSNGEASSSSSSGADSSGIGGWVQPPLEALLGCPVVILNYRSKRKLFAQAGKKPTLLETWAKGFGAGPELKTFKDNKWWLLPLLPQKAKRRGEEDAGGLEEEGVGGRALSAQAAASTIDGTTTFVIMNAHSSRKLYAKCLRSGSAKSHTKWEKEVGCLPADDATCVEVVWKVIRDDATGAFSLQNAVSNRKLFARMPHRGDKWSAGVGAAPHDHSSNIPETLWHLIPDPAHAQGSSKSFSNGGGAVSSAPQSFSGFEAVWAQHLKQNLNQQSWLSSSSPSPSSSARKEKSADAKKSTAVSWGGDSSSSVSASAASGSGEAEKEKKAKKKAATKEGADDDGADDFMAELGKQESLEMEAAAADDEITTATEKRQASDSKKKEKKKKEKESSKRAVKLDEKAEGVDQEAASTSLPSQSNSSSGSFVEKRQEKEKKKKEKSSKSPRSKVSSKGPEEPISTAPEEGVEV